jgi:hypothetical protein
MLNDKVCKALLNTYAASCKINSSNNVPVLSVEVRLNCLVTNPVFGFHVLHFKYFYSKDNFCITVWVKTT